MEFDTSKMEILAERPNKVIYRCGDYTPEWKKPV